MEIVSDQVPNTGDKDEKFNKKRKKKNRFRLLKDEVMTSTKPVIGDVSSGIKVEPRMSLYLIEIPG